MKRLALSVLLSAVYATLVCGCVEDQPAPDLTPEDVPDDVSAWVYVASGVSAASADGTALNPYPSVQAAIDAVAAGGGVKIQPGIYEERLTITKDVVLSGLPTATQEAVLSSVDGASVISISGGAVVRIDDLEITGGQDAVVEVDDAGTSLKLTDAMVRCTPAEELMEEAAGHGLVVTNGADVTVEGGQIQGCAMYGALVDSSKLVIDQMVVISDHKGGGLRYEAALPGSEIRSAIIENNQGFGVGLFCGTLSIINSDISKTTNPGGGDGVVATVLGSLPEGDPRIGCTTDLTVGGEGESQSNTIESNQRAGVLIDGEVSALIQNNKLNYNGNGGVWLVGNPELETTMTRVLQNSVLENLHVGIGVVSQASAEIAGNQVWDTLPIEDFSGETSHGDGIFVEEAVSEVYGNSLRRNIRYGILMREPVKGSCIGDDNTYLENMQAHKWECAGFTIDPCSKTWSSADDLVALDPCSDEEREAGTCEEGVSAPAASAQILSCDSPTCLADPDDSSCPTECGASTDTEGEAYTKMVTTLDCSGCWVDDVTAPECPNDGVDVEAGEALPCCKPNNMDGLGVHANESASSGG